MKKNLTKITPHLQQLKTPEMKVPVIFHTSPDLLPDERTFSQLENLAKDDRLFSHIAAMSDVHPKKGRKNPTGTIVASRTHLFPQINDTAPNCGMRFIKTNLNEKNFSAKKIDALFQELVRVVPTKKYIGTKIPYQLTLEISKHGIAPLLKHFKTRTKNEIENTFSFGNLITKKDIENRDIFDTIPKLFLRTATFRMGILGAAGNHFLDLMKITEIKDKKIADKFGVQKDQYIFLIHTGSGLIGQYASYMYTPKIKEHFSQKLMLKLGTAFFDSQMKKIYEKISQKIKDYQDKEEFLGYEADSLEGKMYLTAHQVASNFGFANRTIINHNLDLALEKILNKQAELNLLYDMPHIFNRLENHFGKDVWIHRNGTTSANGPKRMKHHKLFSQTGEPVFIPSSMSTPAYLGAGTDQNDSSFYSASHGTGRKAQTDNNPKNKKDLFERMKKNKVKLYNAKSKGVIFQDSSYYKDIEEVITGMENNQIVKVVAKMQPVAVLMY